MMQFKQRHKLQDKLIGMGPYTEGGGNDRKANKEIRNDLQVARDLLAQSKADLEEAERLLAEARKSLKQIRFWRWF